MITVLFTDTHFGVKQNSMHWLESQLEFINKQLIPYLHHLEKNEYVRLIHLGDVFDSRSSVSTYVATKVKEVFTKLANSVSEFIIIAGNHDFYSPTSDEVDTIHLILGDINGIQIVSDKCFINDTNMYVPWYKWFDQNELQNIINEKGIKNIFTHADIVTSPVDIVGPVIYSGHIHTPSINKRLRNLGSCYALNFGDSNSERGFYLINDKGTLSFIPNEKSIKFWRLYNDDVFKNELISKIKNNDYIELYINQANMMIPNYIDTINKLTKKFKNIWVIPQTQSLESNGMESFDGYDIESITKELIPVELKEKFNQIINSIKNE